MTVLEESTRINAARLIQDFHTVSQIGATEAGGVCRPALSAAHLEARNWFRERILAAGLTFRSDQAGNHSAFLECAGEHAPTLLIGSHLDSVSNGGRFDGTLGVLAALETLRVIKEQDIQLPVNIEAIDFTDEEGTLVSFLGSYALTGKLHESNLENPRGGTDALEAGLLLAGLDKSSILAAKRAPETLAGYLELHVEQGSRLEKAGVQIGIVSSIAGICFYHINFIGREDHAASVSMEDRLDAGWGASAFSLALRDLVLNEFPGCHANVGRVDYHPGNFNIVPQKTTLQVEFRAPQAAQLIDMKARVRQEAEKSAAHFRLGLEIDFLGERLPVSMDTECRLIIRDVSQQMHLTCLDLGSGPGHDAQAFADICPTAMIFVPSVAGISHSPEEWTHWEDCENGANVLLQTVLKWGRRL